MIGTTTEEALQTRAPSRISESAATWCSAAYPFASRHRVHQRLTRFTSFPSRWFVSNGSGGSPAKPMARVMSHGAQVIEAKYAACISVRRTSARTSKSAVSFQMPCHLYSRDTLPRCSRHVACHRRKRARVLCARMCCSSWEND